MVYLEELLQAVDDPKLKQELTERLDIVQHKIKFMDTVPVACFDADNNLNLTFNDALFMAGGLMVTDIQSAVYLMYQESGKNFNELMRDIPASLEPQWPSVQNNRVLFLVQDNYAVNTAEGYIGLIEDLAEMIHPGSFIFGHEGESWIRFKTE